MRYEVIVLGGGAAGLMCAIEAAKRGRKVALIEHNTEIGRKILISGGGRCNFTNIHCRPENFISSNEHFPKSALARYTPADFVALVRKHGIPFHEKTLGQLFCDRSARDIVSMLRSELAGDIFVDCSVREIRRTSEFVVETNCGRFQSPALVIATGGLSIPKIGATAFGYRVAEQFGLRIVPCRPALVPLVFSGEDRKRYGGLSGVSAEVIASMGRRQFREKMLITHHGLSGPAILQISSYWNSSDEISIDLLPGIDILEQFRRRNKAETKTIVSEHLPKRLAEAWFQLNADPKPANISSARELERLAHDLHHWKLRPGGTEGFEKAEVTAGGVDTDELSSKTFESKKVPGLFFIGEVLDVTGHLGGFNFHWAWASGHAAGQSVG
ncbi:MAG: NAD(P)/FAD-dependent oxidoreductase [Acidobacteria bacterium]|nr:NAD(P)/FAD-dependent oxidoreductase [Acidobacteriota bacterium]